MIAVIGVDPGSTTGYALMNERGLRSWNQGKMETMVPEIIRLARDYRPIALIAIERAFMGKGIRSSLVVAENESFLRGALWQAGVQSEMEMWRPLAAEWRSAHGFRRESKLAHQQALGMATARTGVEFRPKDIHVAEAICIAVAAFEKACDARRRPTMGKA